MNKVEGNKTMWRAIREAQPYDYERLELVAKRFIDRHNLKIADYNPEYSLYDQLNDYLARLDAAGLDDNRRLAKLWWRCIARALNDRRAEGIAYGWVGYSVI